MCGDSFRSGHAEHQGGAEDPAGSSIIGSHQHGGEKASKEHGGDRKSLFRHLPDRGPRETLLFLNLEILNKELFLIRESP